MGSEKPTGPATQHGGSSGSGVQRNDAASPVVTRSADEELPEGPDIVTDAEDSCEAQVKRARTIIGLDVCVLEAPDDVYDEAVGITTNLTEMCGECAADEDVAAPEVTEELNRLKTFGRSYRETIVDETMRRGHVYSQKTETVRGRLVDDMNDDRDKSRFVAAKLARDVKHDVRAGTSVLKALRMTINLATMRDGKHRLRNSVFYDITATFVHPSIDEVVGISLQGGLLEKRKRPLVLTALYGTWMASKRWQRHHMRMLGTHEWTASKTMPSFFQHRNHAETCGCHRSDIMTEGSDEAVQAGRVLIEGGDYGQPRE